MENKRDVAAVQQHRSRERQAAQWLLDEVPQQLHQQSSLQHMSRDGGFFPQQHIRCQSVETQWVLHTVSNGLHEQTGKEGEEACVGRETSKWRNLSSQEKALQVLEKRRCIPHYRSYSPYPFPYLNIECEAIQKRIRESSASATKEAAETSRRDSGALLRSRGNLFSVHYKGRTCLPRLFPYSLSCAAACLWPILWKRWKRSERIAAAAIASSNASFSDATLPVAPPVVAGDADETSAPDSGTSFGSMSGAAAATAAALSTKSGLAAKISTNEGRSASETETAAATLQLAAELHCDCRSSNSSNHCLPHDVQVDSLGEGAHCHPDALQSSNAAHRLRKKEQQQQKQHERSAADRQKPVWVHRQSQIDVATDARENMKMAAADRLLSLSVPSATATLSFACTDGSERGAAATTARAPAESAAADAATTSVGVVVATKSTSADGTHRSADAAAFPGSAVTGEIRDGIDSSGRRSSSSNASSHARTRKCSSNRRRRSAAIRNAIRKCLMVWARRKVYCGEVFASCVRHGCGYTLYVSDGREREKAAAGARAGAAGANNGNNTGKYSQFQGGWDAERLLEGIAGVNKLPHVYVQQQQGNILNVGRSNSNRWRLQHWQPHAYVVERTAAALERRIAERLEMKHRYLPAAPRPFRRLRLRAAAVAKGSSAHHAILLRQQRRRRMRVQKQRFLETAEEFSSTSSLSDALDLSSTPAAALQPVTAISAEQPAAARQQAAARRQQAAAPAKAAPRLINSLSAAIAAEGIETGYLIAGGICGYWQLGSHVGWGVSVQNSGRTLCKYEGYYRKDLKNGWGLETQTHGIRFAGSFWRGIRHGKGVLLYPSGALYFGEYQIGVLHQQTLLFTDFYFESESESSGEEQMQQWPGTVATGQLRRLYGSGASSLQRPNTSGADAHQQQERRAVLTQQEQQQTIAAGLAQQPVNSCASRQQQLRRSEEQQQQRKTQKQPHSKNAAATQKIFTVDSARDPAAAPLLSVAAFQAGQRACQTLTLPQRAPPTQTACIQTEAAAQTAAFQVQPSLPLVTERTGFHTSSATTEAAEPSTLQSSRVVSMPARQTALAVRPVTLAANMSASRTSSFRDAPTNNRTGHGRSDEAAFGSQNNSSRVQRHGDCRRRLRHFSLESLRGQSAAAASSEWSVKQVQYFLSCAGLPQKVLRLLQQQHIDGAALLHATEKDYKEMGIIKWEERRMLLLLVELLLKLMHRHKQRSRYAPEQQQRQQSLMLSTVSIPAAELKLEARIGEGGYSRVYQAKWRYSRYLELEQRHSLLQQQLQQEQQQRRQLEWQQTEERQRKNDAYCAQFATNYTHSFLAADAMQQTFSPKGAASLADEGEGGTSATQRRGTVIAEGQPLCRENSSPQFEAEAACDEGIDDFAAAAAAADAVSREQQQRQQLAAATRVWGFATQRSVNAAGAISSRTGDSNNRSSGAVERERAGGETGEMIVAVKLFRQRQLKSLQRSFYSELAILSRLAHPNIAMLLGVVTAPLYGIVTEFVACGSLFELLHLHQLQLSFEQSVRIARDICFGMAYLHQQGVLHCDLKSPNVLLSSRGEVKLCDFGLATYVETVGAAPAGNDSGNSNDLKDHEVRIAGRQARLALIMGAQTQAEHGRVADFDTSAFSRDDRGNVDDFVADDAASNAHDASLVYTSARDNASAQQQQHHPQQVLQRSMAGVERHRERVNEKHYGNRSSQTGAADAAGGVDFPRGEIKLEAAHLGCVGTHHWMAPEDMSSPAHVITAVGYGGAQPDISRVPPALRTVLLRCIDPSPDKRPSFRWCAEQLQALYTANFLDVEVNLYKLMGVSA